MKFDNIINKGVRLLNLYFEYKYCFNTSECTCNTVRFLNKDSGFPKMWCFEEGGPSTIWCFFKLFQEKSIADCLRRGGGGTFAEVLRIQSVPRPEGPGSLLLSVSGKGAQVQSYRIIQVLQFVWESLIVIILIVTSHVFLPCPIAFRSAFRSAVEFNKDNWRSI